MNLNRNNQNSGFTIVELMLAMSFVSALLLAIAMTVIQIGNIYNHGITLKSVNQSGSAIAREIQRSISGSMPFSIDASHYAVNNASGGRLCTGQYSYIWNYGAANTSSHDLPLYKDRNVYSSGTGDINFVKIYDPGLNYCEPNVGTGAYPPVEQKNALELLNTDQTQSELAIHDFTIDSSADDGATGQKLYNIEFNIGTNDQDTLFTDSNGLNCRPPSDPKSDPFFCSVVRFDITARAGNENSNDQQN